MLSKSLKQAMDEANANVKKADSSWPAEENVRFEIVASRANTTRDVPSIALQFQREDGRRRWFDLYFDEANPKSFRMTGIKLRALGCAELIEQLDSQYPVLDSDPIETQKANGTSQLEVIAASLHGVSFVGRIDRSVNNRTKDLPDEDKEYMNFFHVTELLDGPVAAPVTDSSGFGQTAPKSEGGFGGFGGSSVMGE